MIRCLVVDDSRTFRAILRTILSRAPGVEVVGEAADGHEAVRQVLALAPDVVTMDARMPGRDGLAAIDEIMRTRPTPIVVVSGETGADRQEMAFRALQLGAIEVLPKPRSDGAAFDRDAESIRMAVRAVAGLKLVTRHARWLAPAAPGDAPAHAVPIPARTPMPLPSGVLGLLAPRVLGIAASTGGPAALARILAALPGGYPLPILVVQHIAPGFERGFVHWLGAETPLAVRLAADGDALEPGTVLVGPDGEHLCVEQGRVRLDAGPPVHGFRPSGTALFESLARAYGGGAAGLVLSGMGDDGAEGLALVRRAGGFTAAQGPKTSAIFGMPRVAIERGAAAVTLELDDVAPALVRLARAAAHG